MFKVGARYYAESEKYNDYIVRSGKMGARGYRILQSKSGQNCTSSGTPAWCNLAVSCGLTLSMDIGFGFVWLLYDYYIRSIVCVRNG